MNKIAANPSTITTVRYRLKRAPIRELAERFGVHRTIVTALIHRNGVGVRRAGLSESEISMAVSPYAECLSLARSRAIFGTDDMTARQSLVAAVTMRSARERVSD